MKNYLKLDDYIGEIISPIPIFGSRTGEEMHLLV